jgi:tight adherence protein B
MILLVLGFLSILVVTFALIAGLTRSSPLEKSIERRMALINTSTSYPAGDMPGTVQLLKITRAARFRWVDEAMERFQFSQTLQKRILQANSSTTVSTLLLSSLGLAIAGYAIAWFFAPVILIDIAGAGVMGCLPYGVIFYKRSKRIAAFNSVLAESIDMMARGLRAGYSMLGTIEMLAEQAEEPAASEFREVFKQQNLGLPLRDALLQLLDRVPSLDLRVLVTAILVQKDTGGNLVEILDRTVFVIRERLRIQGEIRVHTAQGRLTGWILSLLPVVLLVLINIVNPGYSHILLYDPSGRRLIYIALGLLATGAVVIHRIINGIEV